jgi:protein gp37
MTSTPERSATVGDKTGIGWTDATWNCVRGCSRVSEGCRNCYAEQQAARIVRMAKGKPSKYDGLVKTIGGEARWTGAVELDAGDLAQPLRWAKPRRIFVNSMSDLFHEKLTNEQIAAVFGVMAAAPWHTYQILTKRAKRMHEWFAWMEEQIEIDGDPWTTLMKETTSCAGRRDWPTTRHLAGHDKAWDRYLAEHDHKEDACFEPWPLPWVWLGVSVENQDAAIERIPELLTTPAEIRFISAEPLIDDVSLFAFLKGPLRDRALAKLGGSATTSGLDWVIAGCESGRGARPCDVAWLRSMRDECAAADVPFFLKQAVAMLSIDRRNEPITFGEGSKGRDNVIELPYLDGVQHAAFPVPE